MTVSRLQSEIKTVERDATQKETVEQLLGDVYELLETYGPSWYSEDLRQRIQTVLIRSRYARA